MLTLDLELLERSTRPPLPSGLEFSVQRLGCAWGLGSSCWLRDHLRTLSTELVEVNALSTRLIPSTTPKTC